MGAISNCQLFFSPQSRTFFFLVPKQVPVTMYKQNSQPGAGAKIKFVTELSFVAGVGVSLFPSQHFLTLLSCSFFGVSIKTETCFISKVCAPVFWHFFSSGRWARVCIVCVNWLCVCFFFCGTLLLLSSCLRGKVLARLQRTIRRQRKSLKARLRAFRSMCFEILFHSIFLLLLIFSSDETKIAVYPGLFWGKIREKGYPSGVNLPNQRSSNWHGARDGKCWANFTTQVTLQVGGGKRDGCQGGSVPGNSILTSVVWSYSFVVANAERI